jgi:hypothetical protein
VLYRGTAIGEHIKSAQEAESRAVFAGEMGAALRNSSATEFWLDLLHDNGFLDDREHDSILTDCKEILKLLTKITKKRIGIHNPKKTIAHSLPANQLAIGNVQWPIACGPQNKPRSLIELIVNCPLHIAN